MLCMNVILLIRLFDESGNTETAVEKSALKSPCSLRSLSDPRPQQTLSPSRSMPTGCSSARLRVCSFCSNHSPIATAHHATSSLPACNFARPLASPTPASLRCSPSHHRPPPRPCSLSPSSIATACRRHRQRAIAPRHHWRIQSRRRISIHRQSRRHSHQTAFRAASTRGTHSTHVPFVLAHRICHSTTSARVPTSAIHSSLPLAHACFATLFLCAQCHFLLRCVVSAVISCRNE